MDLIRICSNSVFNLKVKTNNEFQFPFRCSRHFLFFLNMYLLSATATWLRIIETIATNHVLCLEDFPSYTVSI